ncbi:MAG: FAD-binding oxidoreductase [Candidatus Eremiobacteraeota bacterium]|nr:FAD-binding oxidoreductase [Candidatus Eremiobacteraeota bacterium]
MIRILEGLESASAGLNGAHPAQTQRPDAVNHADVDAAALQAELRSTLRGEVRFDDATRAMYSTDASNYRQVPIGLVVPKDSNDVELALAACRKFGAPVFSRGGGTSLAGETCNAAVVIDFSKYMNEIIDIDWEGKKARVQPGCVNDDLRNTAEQRHLTFGPDPATHNRNTFGGMIGNNSCGMHAQMAGKTEENVEELEIVTYDGLRMRVGPTSDTELEQIIDAGGPKGEIYGKLKALRDKYADQIRARFPQIPRRVSGFPLDQLLPENGFNVARALVGTEGTCVTVVEATVRLVHSPPYRALLMLGFSDLPTAGDMVPFCDEHKPIALEGMAQSMFHYMEAKGESTTSNRGLFPDGTAWLVCEFGGESKQEASDNARGLMEAFKVRDNPPSMKLIEDHDQQKQLWAFRDEALGSTSKIPNEPDYYPGWEDSAVDPKRLGDYLRKFQAMLDEYGYQGAIYGHFGQACVHVSIDFDLFTTAGIAKYREFVTKMAHICVEHGGSLSGEHGDGQARGELLPIMYGDELVQAFWEFKSIWDPQHKMNPGKVVHPYKLDENLRWGANYSPWEPKTHFHYPDDKGSFASAANRCVGTGKCRKHDAGTMCPSYMATKEEAYSTRGRARLLFEMLEGNPMRGGWQDEGVKDALDLCLSCKGCKGECPVNVDMATYKAEFLAHYYEKKRRPIAAYAFGLMYWWARLASFAPGVVNALTQAPGLREIAKAMATVAPQRSIPMFAPQTFRAWFEKRPSTTSSAQPNSAQDDRTVILWPDTWNNHFHPTTAQAAVAVLEDAGFRVTIPKVQLCCGRPLYDYGMLDLAKTMLREVLEALRPQIRAGICIVGLEPSCVSVFRDEMLNLLGPDEDAKRLSEQTFLLTEFLAKKAPEYKPPQLHRKALVQEHCHQKSILDKGSEKKLFDAIGLDYELPDSGCCGMAGPFGFDKAHYDVSIAVGERVLLPKVREAAKDVVIVANGFSCREQISQTTDRQALHPAQVLKMAIDDAQTPRSDVFPELRYMPDIRSESRKAGARGLLGIGGCALVIAVSAALVLRRK